MRLQIPALVALLVVACGPPQAAEPVVETDDQKTLYAVGLVMARNLAGFALDEGELAIVQAGLADGVLGREPKADLQTFGPKIDGLLKARMAVAADKQKASGVEFLEAQAKEPGAEKTDSGMIYIPIQPGEGASPGATDRVRVHYHGTLPDGTVFDSSVQKGSPASFALNGVIPCFSEGLQKMKVGAKSKLICPSNLAYGDRGSPPAIPPGATLSFEVELLEIVGATPSGGESVP